MDVEALNELAGDLLYELDRIARDEWGGYYGGLPLRSRRPELVEAVMRTLLKVAPESVGKG